MLALPTAAVAAEVSHTTAEQPVTSSAASIIALQRAEAMGPVKGTPAAVEGTPTVTSTTLAAAVTDVMGSESPQEAAIAPGPEGGAAFAALVTIRGRFHDWGAKVPEGVEAPTGALLELAINASGRVVAMHLGHPLSEAATATAAVATRLRARASVTSTWPCGATYENAPHCYVQARWKMVNASEKVRGVEADIATTEMGVPDPSADSFVDNEVWAAFPERTNGNGPYWIEAGQEAGLYGDPHQMYWFWAYNNAKGYSQGNPGWPEEGWVFNAYKLESQLDGTWCVKVNGGSAGCEGGLLSYSKWLEAGGEYATAWQPANNVYQQVNYTAVAGEVRTWPGAEWFRSPTTCIEGYSRESPPHYYAGNIRYWVPC
jgi:hypothetical protein